MKRAMESECVNWANVRALAVKEKLANSPCARRLRVLIGNGSSLTVRMRAQDESLCMKRRQCVECHNYESLECMAQRKEI